MKVAKDLSDIFKIADDLRRSNQTEVKFISEDKKAKVVYLMRLEEKGGWSLDFIEDLTPRWKIGDIK